MKRSTLKPRDWDWRHARRVSQSHKRNRRMVVGDKVRKQCGKSSRYRCQHAGEAEQNPGLNSYATILASELSTPQFETLVIISGNGSVASHPSSAPKQEVISSCKLPNMSLAHARHIQPRDFGFESSRYKPRKLARISSQLSGADKTQQPINSPNRW